VRYALIAFVIILVPATEAKIHNLARVNDHIYRGRQPSKEDYPDLAKMGIKTVLDLRGGRVHEPREEREVEAAGMHHISIRLSGIFEPHDWQIAKIIAVLQDADRWPIYIHCRRGDDRLGMVIACYRMVNDHWTNQQALGEAGRLGLSHFEVLMRRYIRHFDAAKVQSLVQRASAGER
jgi:protein tyrosine/serine phosphatase